MRLWILIGILLIMGCESPMNNRVTDEKKQSENQHLKLKSLDFSMEVQWLKGPVGNIKIKNTLMVIIRDSVGEMISLPEGYQLEFYATMPSMNHPMDDAGFFQELSTGIYINESVGYNMAGDWKNELIIYDGNDNEKGRVQWLEFF